MNDSDAPHPHATPINMLPPPPPGLDCLYSVCKKIYPTQVNPLQVTALLKYWLGGPDPLDYISMYANPGVPEQDVPPHWHYISFGLSDLHGDGRVHEVTGPDAVSGFGFELTFRLKQEPGETAPPTWPATLMQSLAKYVFQSGNTLCPGDHVSWHCALDNSESRIQHMLMMSDVQLKPTKTPHGLVYFVQIVGVCAEELKAAQQWNGLGILDIISKIPLAGGPWFITDMRRGESIFELNPNAHEEVERGFELEGSNLSGVSARCSWTERKTDDEESPGKSGEDDGIKSTYCSHDYMSKGECSELMAVKKLEGVHLVFNLEAGSLLPLALRGRVKHGRHFTFKSVLTETAITLVSSTVTDTLVDVEHPYAAQGHWVQVLVPDDLAQDMAMKFHVLLNEGSDNLTLPTTFSWPSNSLSVTIVPDKS